MPVPTPYCTQADLEAVIGRQSLLVAAPDPNNTPDPGTPDAVDTDAVARAIAAVSSHIDGWLRTRYSLPLADVPEVLRRAAARLVHAELVNESTTTDLVESRAAATTKLFEQIAAGRIRIGGDLDGDDTDQNTSTGHSRAHVAKRRIGYGRDSLRGLV